MLLYQYQYTPDKKIWINKYCYDKYPYTFMMNNMIYDVKQINDFYNNINEKTKGVLDVGAQVGSFALMAKFYPDVKFYAFEPVKESYELLVFNKYLNEEYNLECYNIALSDKKETKFIKNSSHKGLCTFGNKPLHTNGHCGVIEYPFNDELVQCDLIDNYFMDKEINLIKIDTEGWEYFVLKGGINVINKWKPKILLEIEDCHLTEAGLTKQMMYDFINSINYKITNTHYMIEKDTNNNLINTTNGDIFIEPI